MCRRTIARRHADWILSAALGPTFFRRPRNFSTLGSSSSTRRAHVRPLSDLAREPRREAQRGRARRREPHERGGDRARRVRALELVEEQVGRLHHVLVRRDAHLVDLVQPAHAALLGELALLAVDEVVVLRVGEPHEHVVADAHRRQRLAALLARDRVEVPRLVGEVAVSHRRACARRQVRMARRQPPARRQLDGARAPRALPGRGRLHGPTRAERPYASEIGVTRRFCDVIASM